MELKMLNVGKVTGNLGEWPVFVVFGVNENMGKA